jgi:hypothetical protein
VPVLRPWARAPLGSSGVLQTAKVRARFRCGVCWFDGGGPALDLEEGKALPDSFIDQGLAAGRATHVASQNLDGFSRAGREMVGFLFLRRRRRCQGVVVAVEEVQSCSGVVYAVFASVVVLVCVGLRVFSTVRCMLI